MKASYFVFFALSLMLMANGALADSHTHHHAEAAAPPALSLNKGSRWASDPVMRTGMSGIRDLMAKEIESIHEGKATAKSYTSLSLAVEERVNRMLKDCKHAPGADQVFHRLLAEIIEGNAKMKEGLPAARRLGALQILKALEEYPQFFTHESWRRIEH